MLLDRIFLVDIFKLNIMINYMYCLKPVSLSYFGCVKNAFGKSKNNLSQDVSTRRNFLSENN